MDCASVSLSWAERAKQAGWPGEKTNLFTKANQVSGCGCLLSVVWLISIAVCLSGARSGSRGEGKIWLFLVLNITLSDRVSLFDYDRHHHQHHHQKDVDDDDAETNQSSFYISRLCMESGKNCLRKCVQHANIEISSPPTTKHPIQSKLAPAAAAVKLLAAARRLMKPTDRRTQEEPRGQLWAPLIDCAQTNSRGERESCTFFLPPITFRSLLVRKIGGGQVLSNTRNSSRLTGACL